MLFDLQRPTTALIVVDVQNDFLPGGALAVPAGDEIVAPVNALIAAAKTVVLTADWHPAGHQSFAANHPGAQPFEKNPMPYGEQVLWPVHCVAGTAGADFAPALDTTKAALILRKGMDASRDSYSAFLEADRTTHTGLEGWLVERGITEVVVCGLAADYCVSATALDAEHAGFGVCVAVDATRAIGEDSLQLARKAWQEAGIRTMSTAALLG